MIELKLKIKRFYPAFTLLELLIVVGITGILATVGISTYYSHQKLKLLDSTAQEIVSYLRYAQQKAIAQEENSAWGVHFENPTSGRGFYSLYKGESYSSPVDTKYLPAGIDFVSPDEGQTLDIPFYKLVGNSSGGTITIIGYQNQVRTITVQSQGLVMLNTGNTTTGYAWNSRIGWINWGATGGNIVVPEGSGELSGMAYSNNGGWISLSCVSTNSCGSVDYKVTKDADGNLSGWAWSEKFGWISFNCSNDNSCASSNYKVTINSSTNEFEGYAWSENLGWISFNCNTGGPSQTNICDQSNYKVRKL